MWFEQLEHMWVVMPWWALLLIMAPILIPLFLQMISDGPGPWARIENKIMEYRFRRAGKK